MRMKVSPATGAYTLFLQNSSFVCSKHSTIDIHNAHQINYSLQDSKAQCDRMPKVALTAAARENETHGNAQVIQIDIKANV